MTAEEFEIYYGMKPERAKELMFSLARFIDAEVKETIEHADYYMNPLDYVDEDALKAKYGADCLEKYSDEDDGYSRLYDYKKDNSPESVFMNFISRLTLHGGYGSACAACELMGIREDGWTE